jgi:hypothetical protein
MPPRDTGRDLWPIPRPPRCGAGVAEGQAVGRLAGAEGCCDRLDRLDQHAVRVGGDVCVEEPVMPTCVEMRGDRRGDISTKAWCGRRRGERCRCRIV